MIWLKSIPLHGKFRKRVQILGEKFTISSTCGFLGTRNVIESCWLTWNVTYFHFHSYMSKHWNKQRKLKRTSLGKHQLLFVKTDHKMGMFCSDPPKINYDMTSELNGKKINGSFGLNDILKFLFINALQALHWLDPITNFFRA